MKRYSGKLFCFSPPVMIATFFIEIGFALYTLWRYKLNAVTRLTALILVCLALFQGAEYMVCEGALGLSSEGWSRLGFVSITALPVLGLHLAIVLAGKKLPRLVIGAYASGIAFAAFFLLGHHAVSYEVCQGNYVIFGIGANLTWLYMLYYYGWLLLTMWLGATWAKLQKKKPVKRALEALAIGYVLFLVPTTAVTVADPAASAAIPSIMCGFAVVLAIALVGWVIPVAKLRR